MSDADVSKVREFETVIDTGYRSLAIFDYPLDVALYGVLAAYDSHIYTQLVVRENRNWAPLAVGQSQLFKNLAEGLVWGLRWLLDGREVVDVQPEANEKLLGHGHQLIEYGLKYNAVANMYSAFSQGRMDVSVDSAARTVRFDYKPTYPATSPTWGFFDEVSNEDLRRTPEEERLRRLQSRAHSLFLRADHHCADGHVVLDDLSLLRDPDVRAHAEFACPSYEVFPPDQDLGGFSIRDLTAFFHSLYAWSAFATERYLQFPAKRVAQEDCMPTQVVPLYVFLQAISNASRLPTSLVERILEQLKYDYRTTKPDIFLQPLVCGEKFVAWSAMVVQLSRFKRNRLKLMARTPSQKSLADRIIGERERAMLSAMKAWLENKGWAVVINRKIPGDLGEVDLLATHWQFPSEILIMEGKAVLQADDLNEIRSATREMQRGQEQIKKVMGLLSRMPDQERSRLFPFVEWKKVSRWYGIVVTPETEPGMGFDQSIIPAAAFLTLQQRLSKKDWASPSRVWNAMVAREWQETVREATFSHEPIVLAGITFEIPLIKFKE